MRGKVKDWKGGLCKAHPDAQYPNASTDKRQAVAKARCVSACAGKK